jgi:predicted small lipoprotein YifL
MIGFGPQRLLVAAVVALALAGCATQGPDTPPAAASPPPAAALPSSIPARDLVGRWGYASYHKETDRARTEAAARGQCGQPYVIGAGPSGGVLMHLADEAQQQELQLKGGPGGKNYVGPGGPAGDAKDREIVSFDGRVLVLRWVDPEVAGRYGTGIYVRCAARA